MKFVTSRDFRSKPKQIWKTLSKEKTMVITVNGKPVAVLLSTTDETFEDSLDTLRRVQTEKAVLEMQTKSVKSGLDKLTLDVISAEIGVARQERCAAFIADNFSESLQGLDFLKYPNPLPR